MNLLLILRRWARHPDDTIEAFIELNGRRVGRIMLRSRDWDALERGHVELTVADSVVPERRRRSA